MGWAFIAYMDGAVIVLGDAQNAGLQGSTLSNPRMTTGFGPFEPPTRGLLGNI